MVFRLYSPEEIAASSIQVVRFAYRLSIVACILKLPGTHGKGVVTFTTQERDLFILPDRRLQDRIERLKSAWLVGLHHNWHDWSFRYNPLFDFSMAGEDDLRVSGGKEVPLVPMDACNFIPPCFMRRNEGEKFWDILYVARAVFFKKIPEFLQIIRRLYDNGHPLRVLFLCPIPPYDRKSRKTSYRDIRREFEALFTPEERHRFTLITFEADYPFPLDLETLAHFYRSSKVFVHAPDDERRCRVASYAWAAGLPVVGMDCVGSLLPSELRRPPIFYRAESHARFDEAILAALGVPSESSSAREEATLFFSPEESLRKLLLHLRAQMERTGAAWEESSLFVEKLDIRLGRHHADMTGPNHLRPGIAAFLDLLEDRSQWASLSGPDPERRFENLLSTVQGEGCAGGLSRVLARLIPTIR